MKLSVVMAVRDGQPYVPEAIESVLAQSFADFEFIIVDDGSMDDTPGILRRYERSDSRIRVLRNPTSIGPYPSANRGLEEARGRFIARHDGDDVSPSTRFAVQLEALESADDIALVTGAIESFGCEHSPHVKRPPSWQPRLEWELLFRNVVGAGAHVMFPRVVRSTVIRFPERYPYAEDYRLWCLLSRLGRVVCPEQIVYRHRQHQLSITCSRRTRQVDCLSAMRCEYQAEHLSTSVERDVSLALSHFWNRSTERLVFANFQEVSATLTQLRRRFLEYVRRRYGWRDGIALDTDIDDALRERLSHWLCRIARPGLPEIGDSIYQGMRVDRLREV